ncbi:MAG: metallophosphoesterase [Clostridiaceae bacterium]|nr:metallophosphoesterase [Clostridiaceae bacterium]
MVFTGDLVDKKTEDVTNSVNTLVELNKWAQVYYIPGNHEYRCEKVELIFRMLEEENVEVLNLKTQAGIVKEVGIDIIGIDEMVNSVESINKKMTEFEKINSFKIVLSHFPENFPRYYSSYDVDLVLSGHAHGGQFNIPLLGGLYAPGQGFFPEYYKGIYLENGVNLVVSRGLGNSVIPLRIFNNPEVVVINIKPS